ncbi:TetR family transcriptional regulatory protein [Agrobacterium sp. ATCC 31749]|nr:TetR family transcriptional regulatory protein [Agrobacterium sp. ATCC 31749]
MSLYCLSVDNQRTSVSDHPAIGLRSCRTFMMMSKAFERVAGKEHLDGFVHNVAGLLGMRDLCEAQHPVEDQRLVDKANKLPSGEVRVVNSDKVCGLEMFHISNKGFQCGALAPVDVSLRQCRVTSAFPNDHTCCVNRFLRKPESHDCKANLLQSPDWITQGIGRVSDFHHGNTRPYPLHSRGKQRFLVAELVEDRSTRYPGFGGDHGHAYRVGAFCQQQTDCGIKYQFTAVGWACVIKSVHLFSPFWCLEMHCTVQCIYFAKIDAPTLSEAK